ncbi:MAG: hypothetical protein IKA05_00285 [Clostridia bacterium]|nr:hypothetical protein [Clostridia bacterium]
MKLTFQLHNNHFEDAFSISLNGQKQTMDKENRSVVFEVEDTPEYLVRIDRLCTDDHTGDDIIGRGQKIRNPVLKILSCFLLVLLFPIILILSFVAFLADHDNGINVHKFFYEIDPFELTKTVRIKATETPILISYQKSQYKKDACVLVPPDLFIQKATAVEESKCCRYRRSFFQREFAWYHIPSYALFFTIILLLTALMFWCLVGQFSPPDLFGIVGMSFCCIVMLGLLIAFICLFVCTCKIFKRIDRALKEKN